MIACANKGKGWHLTTPYEWAALGYWCKKHGCIPRGNNSNVDPPADIDVINETAILDTHLHTENGTLHRALPGTGPLTWTHNRASSGIWDLNGLVWEWNMMFMTTAGFLRYPASLDLTYGSSPYGRGTITDSGAAAPKLTLDGAGVNWLKSHGVTDFDGLKIYIAEAPGLYDIVAANAWSEANHQLTLANGAAPGNGTATYVILKTDGTDITVGITSGHKILTLRESDADLKHMGIPATADATGTWLYGYDVIYHDKAADRAALRGGYFTNDAGAGVFALDLDTAPSGSASSTGFRACKAL